jgi:ABC-type Mn2+/Zn2+ transport system ATPase subunit
MSNHHFIVQNLTVSYGKIPAIHHLNLDLTCGHCIGLLGPNGAGKTTLIKAMAGLVKWETGQVFFHGCSHSHSKQDRRVAYLPQRGMVDWDFPITVQGMVEMGRFSALGGLKPFSVKDRMVVHEALSVVRLSDLANRQINALSGGQQQRAFLARAYAQQAHVYLLDEPFGGLDINAQADLRQILRTLAAAGKLLLVSHHDLKSVHDLFDQVILLNGELVAYGQIDEVFTPENIARTYSTPIFTGLST